MEYFDSSIYGKIPQPSSFEEIFALAIDPGPDSYRAVRMWRGQGDIEWPLHSTGYRRLMMKDAFISGSGTPTEEDMRWFEKGVLKAADHKGYRFHNGRRLSDLELLALMRHHGAATRLLDFSRSLLVGLWFCSGFEFDRIGILVVIHAHYIGGYEGEPEDREYDSVMDAIKNLSHPMTWEPSPNSPRVSAQHSQIVYSRVSQSKMGSLDLPDGEDQTIFIAITPKLKSHLNKILTETFDIRYSTMFPDFSGFSYSRSVYVHPDNDHRW